eukprot:13405-Prymnesium_polylepis.2
MFAEAAPICAALWLCIVLVARLGDTLNRVELLRPTVDDLRIDPLRVDARLLYESLDSPEASIRKETKGAPIAVSNSSREMQADLIVEMALTVAYRLSCSMSARSPNTAPGPSVASFFSSSSKYVGLAVHDHEEGVAGVILLEDRLAGLRVVAYAHSCSSAGCGVGDRWARGWPGARGRTQRALIANSPGRTLAP